MNDKIGRIIMSPETREIILNFWIPGEDFEDKKSWFDMLLFCPEVQIAIQHFIDGNTDIKWVLEELDKALMIARDGVQILSENFCGKKVLN